MGERSGVWGEAAAFLQETVASVEDVVDARWRRLRLRLGWTGRPAVMPYGGYANGTTAWVRGRVLTNRPPRGPQEDDGWWANLAAMYQRLESDEVPDARVAVTLGGETHAVLSDAEGYVTLECPDPGPEGRGPWITGSMRVVSSPEGPGDGAAALVRVMTPSPEAAFGIISDVDDTVIQTDAANVLSMARHTFFHNARTRSPLEGAAAWYRAMHERPGGADNPVFYVSSSPWNLHDLLEDFLDLNGFPAGPLMLRDLGIGAADGPALGHGHKLDKALKILDAFPRLPFVLVGDSGQEDSRLYAEAAERRPGRVLASFIRDVDPDLASHRDDGVAAAAERSAAAGTPMHLVADSDGAAEIARGLGLMS